MFKRPSYQFLHFTKKEKNGTLFLLFVILLLASVPVLYSLIFKNKKVVNAEFKNELASLKMKSVDSSKRNYSRNYGDYSSINNNRSVSNDGGDDNKSVSRFYFDPNTLSADGWMKLGLREKNIATIQNYLKKGGKFRQPTDLKKIWGLREEVVTQLMPFVRIEQAAPSGQHFPTYEKTAFPKKIINVVDVNTADSSGYLALPGIGPGYAKRIIRFRDKLGGFYKVEQVSETFGLPDSTFQKIKSYLKISGEGLKKININTATMDELKEHPYIRYQLANAIIQYRSQHGNFSTIDDLKKMILFTDEVFGKVGPYLKLE